ncbi:Lrp/AsnC family transcriptional regulator [Candidatus Bathyarchaeota archaeon]|nr:Lrp/AsnC family transcriptional regulator [Candidatus Bathyarchaeota archaeon]
MEREEVILGYRTVLDYRKLGQGLTAFVHLTLAYPQCCNDELADVLRELPGVVEGHYTDGDYDVFLKVVTESPESLRDVLNLINAVDGVANTKTIISLTNPIREF